MAPYLYEHFGNPPPIPMVKAKLAIENAQTGCQCHQLPVLGQNHHLKGGTESNNSAIRGYALPTAQRGRHIITSAIEHPAVLGGRYLEEQGFRVTHSPVTNSSCGPTQDLTNAPYE